MLTLIHTPSISQDYIMIYARPVAFWRIDRMIDIVVKDGDGGEGNLERFGEKGIKRSFNVRHELLVIGLMEMSHKI